MAFSMNVTGYGRFVSGLTHLSAKVMCVRPVVVKLRIYCITSYSVGNVFEERFKLGTSLPVRDLQFTLLEDFLADFCLIVFAESFRQVLSLGSLSFANIFEHCVRL